MRNLGKGRLEVIITVFKQFYNGMGFILLLSNTVRNQGDGLSFDQYFSVLAIRHLILKTKNPQKNDNPQKSTKNQIPQISPPSNEYIHGLRIRSKSFDGQSSHRAYHNSVLKQKLDWNGLSNIANRMTQPRNALYC
jgi:hypothetical protein